MFFSRSQQLLRSPHLAVLMAAVPLLVWLRGGKLFRQPASMMAVIFTLIALFQVQFGRVGEFFRYEAHLVCLGLVIATCLALQIPWKSPRWRLSPPMWSCGLAAGALCIVVPLLGMGVFGHVRTPKTAACVYRQQYQMSRFLGQYYDRDSIAANDIGAIDFFTNARCLDLSGLGNIEVARLKLAHQYGVQDMHRLVRENNVKVVVIYSWWFRDIPAEWIKVGDWTIPENVICSGDTVTFYAVGPAQRRVLRRQLEEFSPRLPGEVRVALVDQPPHQANTAAALVRPAGKSQ